MKYSTLLNTPRKLKRKKKRKSSARQREYRALVKKLGGVVPAARAWRKRHKKVAANRTTKRRRKTVRRKARKSAIRRKRRSPRRNVSRNRSLNVSRNRSRNVSSNRRRPARKRRRNTMSKNRMRRVRNGLVAANRIPMTSAWKKRYKAGVRRKRSRGRGKFSLARWKRGSLASYNPFKARGLKKLSVDALKVGVPVVTSGLVGYLLPFWLMQRYPQYVNTMWKRHVLAAATALLAGGATLYASKKNMGLAIAAAMSAVAGYLVPTVGVKLMAKLPGVVPAAPEGVSGLGMTPELRAATARGIDSAIQEAGLGTYTEGQLVDAPTLGQSYTEGQVVTAETLGVYTEREIAAAPTMAGSSEFGQAVRNRF